MRTKIILFVLAVSLSYCRSHGQQSPGHWLILTNMTWSILPTPNVLTFGFLDGITTRFDGFEGRFIATTSTNAVIDGVNVFGITNSVGQSGRWIRMSDRGSGTNGPVGPVGGIDVTGTLPNTLTVVGIRGVPLGTTTATAGNILVAENGVWQSLPMTGDSTISSNAVLTLVNTAVTPGSYGSASQVGAFTVDSKGRLTAAGNTTISVALGSMVTGDLPFANIAQIANNSILGNFTGGTADIQVLTSITSANLLQVLSDETGTGVAVFNTAPAFVTSISTPLIITASGNLNVTPAAGSSVIFSTSGAGDFIFNTNQIYGDSSTQMTGFGTPTPEVGVHIKGDGALGIFKVERTGLSAIVGEVGVATFNTDSKTNGAGVIISLAMKDSATTDQNYAQIISKITDSLTTSEDGTLEFWTVKAGTMTQQAIISDGNLLVNHPTGIAKLSVDGGVYIGSGVVNPGANNLTVTGLTKTLTLLVDTTSTLTGNMTYTPATDERVAVFAGGKILASSTVTTTTLAFLDATSSIQTQINTKVQKPIYGVVDPNAPTAVVGTDGQWYQRTDTGDRWMYSSATGTWTF